MRHLAIVAAVLLVTTSASASPRGAGIPPFRQTCVGVLFNNQAGYLSLDTGNKMTDEHLPKWILPFDLDRDVICTTPLPKKATAKILKVCKIGQLCAITGMVKDYYREQFDWLRVDSVSIPPDPV